MARVNDPVPHILCTSRKLSVLLYDIETNESIGQADHSKLQIALDLHPEKSAAVSLLEGNFESFSVFLL